MVCCAVAISLAFFWFSLYTIPCTGFFFTGSLWQPRVLVAFVETCRAFLLFTAASADIMEMQQHIPRWFEVVHASTYAFLNLHSFITP
jgi:hypothetical protein